LKTRKLKKGGDFEKRVLGIFGPERAKVQEDGDSCIGSLIIYVKYK